MHDVEHAVGQTGLGQQFGDLDRGRRVLLGRLQDEGVAAVAMAIGNIHIGTIAGKLNGVMPATTPSGWRIEDDVDAGWRPGGQLALELLR